MSSVHQFNEEAARLEAALSQKQRLFRRADDLVQNLTAPNYILQGVYERGLMYTLIGPPKQGKSTIVLDQAACIATGTRWCDRGVEQGAVFIIAGEGHSGIQRRLHAWSLHNQRSLRDAPLYVSKTAVQFLDLKSAQRLTDELAELQEESRISPTLIVIDTLARNYGPGDENSADDMGRFVAQVDRLRDSIGCAVVIVHHTPIATSERPRGSSALFGSVDGVFIAGKPDTGSKVTVLKAGEQKELAAGDFEYHFELHPIVIPGLVDNFGEGVTAVVPRQIQPNAALAQPDGRNQKLAMKTLRDMYEEHERNLKGQGTPRVMIETWRDRFIAECGAKNPRDAWAGVLKAATGSQWCRIDHPFAYPPERES